MIKFGSLNEIIDFAIAKEEASNQFYLDLANRVNSPQAHETFKKLAEEENSHKTNLQLELKKRGQVVSPPQDEKTGHYSEYILESDLPMDITYPQILAIRKENASFRSTQPSGGLPSAPSPSPSMPFSSK